MAHIDKTALREKLLTLEHVSVQAAQMHYEAYLKGAQLDVGAVDDASNRAQVFQSGQGAQDVEHQLHVHEKHLQKIRLINFDRKQIVEEGAVVKVSGRYLIVAVPTAPFTFNGVDMLGVSADAPLIKAIAGLRAGDTGEFNRKDVRVAEVH